MTSGVRTGVPEGEGSVGGLEELDFSQEGRGEDLNPGSRVFSLLLLSALAPPQAALRLVCL